MSEYVLHQVRFSHFNEKARWALDYKGVPHRRVTHAPGMHAISSRRLGGSGTMPLLVVDGEAITDSADVIAALERSHPDPALYPGDAAERSRALELESWLGEELGPPIRSMFFAHLLPETRLSVRTMTQGLSAPARAVMTATFPLTRPMVRRSLPADAAAGERGREKTLVAMDRIESELRPSGYLAGDAFSVADLTAAALLFPLVGPAQYQYELPDPGAESWEEFRSEQRDRPAWRHAEEMWARHRGESAEVAT